MKQQNNFLKILIDDRDTAQQDITDRHLGQKALTYMCANMMGICNLIGQLTCAAYPFNRRIRGVVEHHANLVSEGYSGGNDLFGNIQLEKIVANLDDTIVNILQSKTDDKIIFNNPEPSAKFFHNDVGDIMVEDIDGNFWVNGHLMKPGVK